MDVNFTDVSSAIRDPAAAKTTAPTQSLTGKDTFLQLLVAQIKNQNPLNPADGVEFLTQLAQFSSLEQTMDIRNELQTIRKALVPDTTTETSDSTKKEN
jgi:flagellar basal-body rod modification protein FlgD